MKRMFRLHVPDAEWEPAGTEWEELPTLLSMLVSIEAVEPIVLYQCWNRLMSYARRVPREAIPPALSQLAPVHRALGGDDAVDGVIQSVLDVGTWWP